MRYVTGIVSLGQCGTCSVTAVTVYTGRSLQAKKRGYIGVFKRLRRNGHLENQKAANSSAQTVTLEAQPQRKAPVREA
jgi:hypothetical protein